jgi:predicted acetyltransferase/predicted N-acetyltransferase YhbS
MNVRRVSGAEASRRVDSLADLLMDAVASGASIGFLWPLPRDQAVAYWRDFLAALDDDLALWVAEDEGEVVGTVQLSRCRKPNGRHRAEVQKLFVHSQRRGRGVATRLLAEAEAHARARECTLLMLDTESGSVAETVYQRAGWRKAGEIPNFALTPDGRMHATAYHYKDLATKTGHLELVRPTRAHLPGYVEALKAGWSNDNVRGLAAAKEELDAIEADADLFIERQYDREAKGPPVTLPDGSTVARIPGYRLWMWDGEFCGTIGLRWQPGNDALPPHVLGHIGYAVVPWKRNRGYAKRALALILEHARAEGLRYVELTTDFVNVASQRTIVANGGVLHEQFVKPAQYGGARALRYRITLDARDDESPQHHPEYSTEAS